MKLRNLKARAQLCPTLSLIFLLTVSSGSSESLAAGNRKEEPKLTIKSPEKTLIYSRSELLQRKDIVILETEGDPAYSGRKMAYKAVPAKALFEGIRIPQGGTLQFHCIDGFSAPISAEKILNVSESKEQSIPYIAIETEDHKWPPLNPPTDSKTAGPFYLVWKNPKLSKIAREEWPYQLSGFEVKKSLSESFPRILPASNLDEDHPVRRGFKIFTRDCFVCHTINLQGESKLGPDLNVPMNPVEYLTPAALRIVIRDPQALRFWPLSKMHGFSKEQLPDSEMNDLLDYLKHMVERKVKTPESHLNSK